MMHQMYQIDEVSLYIRRMKHSSVVLHHRTFNKYMDYMFCIAKNPRYGQLHQRASLKYEYFESDSVIAAKGVERGRKNMKARISQYYFFQLSRSRIFFLCIMFNNILVCYEGSSSRRNSSSIYCAVLHHRSGILVDIAQWQIS